jgi:hypothetical protein
MYCIYKNTYISNFALDCHNFGLEFNPLLQALQKFGAISVWRLFLFHKSVFTNALEFFQVLLFSPKALQGSIHMPLSCSNACNSGHYTPPRPHCPPIKLCRVVVLCLSSSCSKPAWGFMF